MGLSFEERGYLDKLLDLTVKDATSLVEVWRKDDMIKYLGVKSEEDFSLGYVLGDFFKGYFSSFRERNRRVPDNTEQDEMWSTVQSRIGQIKESIFKAG